jgi:uncharacterized membrane protein
VSSGSHAQTPRPVLSARGSFVAAALLILAVLLLLIELRAIEYAYERIGVSSRYLSLTLLATLLGSYVNIPLWRRGGRQSSRLVKCEHSAFDGSCR